MALSTMSWTNFYSPALDLSDANTQARADQNNIRINGLPAWNNGRGTGAPKTLAGQVAVGFTLAYAQGERGVAGGVAAAQNLLVSDPDLNRPFESSDPDFTGRFGSPVFRVGWVSPPDDGFFDPAARFLGGMGDADWTKEWPNFTQDADAAP